MCFYKRNLTIRRHGFLETAPAGRHLRPRPLLDRDSVARGRAEVDRRGGTGDVEGDAVVPGIELVSNVGS